MFRSIKTLLACAAVALCAACATTGAPSADTVQGIQNACAIDAGFRPTVDALLVLATPSEAAIVDEARAIIDPICKNPGGTVQANAIAAVAGSSAQILAVLSKLQERNAASHAKPVAAAAGG